MNGFTENLITAMLVFTLILLVAFFVFRALLLWYWRVNESIVLLTEIRDLLVRQGSGYSDKTSHSNLQSGGEAQSETDCIRTLESLGYKVARKSSGWQIKEPLGGNAQIRSLTELAEYASSKKIQRN